MPKPVPGIGLPDWGKPLNDHLKQLMNPVTGGFHLWYGEAKRPWANGSAGDTTVKFGSVSTLADVDELDNLTGYNEETGNFERWDATGNLWIVMQPIVQNPFEINPAGTVHLYGDVPGLYIYLTNSTGDLGDLVTRGDLIEITAANDGNTLKIYYVEEIIETNKVRVTAQNPQYISAVSTPPRTITLNEDGEGNRFEMTSTEYPNFFNVGDKYRATDTGSTVIERISQYQYRQQGFSAIVNTSPREILTLYIAPIGDNAYRIFKPTIKYNDIEGRVAFSTDRYGLNRLGETYIASADDLPSEAGDLVLAKHLSRTFKGETALGAFAQWSREYAVSTLANPDRFNRVSGLKLEFTRTEATEINPAASTNPADWNGSLGDDANGLFVFFGHGPNLQDTSTTITSPYLEGLRIGADTRGGKIENITHLHIRQFILDASKGVAPDEMWGIVEEASGSGKPSRNFFAGNTCIGSPVADASVSQPDYSALTEKFRVYGNAEILEHTGGTKGNLVVSGTVTAGGTVLTSDERLKRKITELSASTALETVAQLQAKSFEFEHTPGATRYGVIAQELEAVLPELVGENKDGFKTVNYIELIPFLLESIKELKREVDDLKASR